MQVDLTDSTAIVIGAGHSNAEGTAKRVVANGATVIVNDIDARPGEETVADIEATGGIASAVTADVSDAAAVQAMFEQATDTLGTIDILVNNAGIADSVPMADKPAPETWAKALDANLWGPSTAVPRPSAEWLARETRK